MDDYIRTYPKSRSSNKYVVSIEYRVSCSATVACKELQSIESCLELLEIWQSCHHPTFDTTVVLPPEDLEGAIIPPVVVP